MSERPRGGYPRYTRAFWFCLATGVAVLLYGVFGLVENAGSTHGREVATWLIGLDLAHDLLVAPLLCGAGVVLARALRRPWRAPLQVGLLTSAMVLAVGWMNLLGYGRRRTNPTQLPLDYATAVLTALAFVWTAVTVWVLLALLRARRAPSGARRARAS